MVCMHIRSLLEHCSRPFSFCATNVLAFRVITLWHFSRAFATAAIGVGTALGVAVLGVMVPPGVTPGVPDGVGDR